MNEPTYIPFAGTEEELEKLLVEFARTTGSQPGRETKPAAGWRLIGGVRLSLNPNTVPWSLRVRREAEGLVVEGTDWSPPWMRAKRRRLAAYRAGQLADYLAIRARGSGPEKFDGARLRAPFAPFGDSVADRTASFAWLVMTCAFAFAFAGLFAALISLPLMHQALRRIALHSAALESVGAIPLPSPSEAAGTSVLGPSMVFAFPLAFLAGLLYSAALAVCDLGAWAARVPQACAVFLTLLVGCALYPFLSMAAIALAPLLPLGAHLGATFVWARRGERVRQEAPPSRAIMAIGVLLAASLAGAIVPRGSDWKGSLLQMALIRDTWLLGNPLGRTLALTYYRYTPYATEPIRADFCLDGRRPVRQQVLVACTDAAVGARLRALHLVVSGAPAGADIIVGPGGLNPGKNLPELEAALDRDSRARFRGGWLLDVTWLSWRILYYASPLVLLLLLMGAFAPVVAVLLRKLKRPLAVFVLSACAMVISLSLVLLRMQGAPVSLPEDLAEALGDYRTGIRHEAAFRACQLENPAPLAGALLVAADDRDLRVRLWACAALGKTGDPRALPKLLERLEDPEPFVRYRAAEGLGWLRDPRASAALRSMMRKRSWYEGGYALDALRAIRRESH